MGISREQALDCFRSDDLVGLGMEADAVRRRLHPEGVVSYGIDCTVTEPLPADAVYNEIADAVEMGATGVRITSATAEVEPLEELVVGIRRRFPTLTITGLTASQVLALATACGSGLHETLLRLHGAGLDSLTDDDIAQRACSPQEWIDVHRAAHGMGMSTVAALVFGAGETTERRVEFLEMLRNLQQETGGFAAFVPVAAAAPGGRELDGVTAVERLKMLAIARMFLDNIENLQSRHTGQALKVLQTGLRFGANDLGSGSSASDEDLRRIIRDAGFKPVQRDSLYRTMLLT